MGEHNIFYDLNFKTKKIHIKIKDTSNVLVNEKTIDLSNLGDYENIDFSNFKYIAAARTSNGENQIFYPQELALNFDKENTLVKEFTKSFSLDLSMQDEGNIKLYAKVDGNEIESNVAELELFKDTNFLKKPTNISISDIKYNQAKYSWNDNTSGKYSEEKYIIKDEKNNIIVDNLTKDSIEYVEVGLKERTNYSRKICVIFENFEKCSSLIHFTTLSNIKIYNVELLVGNGGNVVLPEQISQYNISMTNNNIFAAYRSTSQFYTNNNKFSFVVHRPGTSKIILKDKILGYEKYIINITSVIPEIDLNLVLTEYKNLGLLTRDKYEYSDSSIVSYRSRGFYAEKIGKTDVIVSRNSIIKQIFHITILPIPEPKIVECTTIIGDRCIFQMSNDGYYQEQFPGGVGEIKTGSKTFYVKGIKPGVVKLYIKKYRTDYVSHIFKVTIRSKPLIHFTCTSPQGIDCLTNWRGDDKEYTYKVSNKDILDLKLYRYKQGNKIYEKLHVKGKIPGTADVYIYENGEHIVTFNIIVQKPVSKIILEKSSFSLKQLEVKEIKILNGGGEYKKVIGYDKEILNFSVDNTENNKGIIRLAGVNPGKTKITLKDEYGQTITITVKVEDLKLSLSYPKTGVNNELLLNKNYEYVNIKEAYRGIKKISQNNDNVEVYLTNIEVNGEIVKIIKVIPKRSGTTLLKVEDYEGNFENVKIRVGDLSSVGSEGSEGNSGVENGEDVEDSSNKPEETTSEDSSIEDLIKELEKLFEENGIDINSIEGVEINASYGETLINTRYNLAINKLKKSEKGIKMISKVSKISNSLQKKDIFIQDELLEYIEYIAEQYKEKTKKYSDETRELIDGTFELLISSIEGNIKDFRTRNPEERIKYDKELVQGFVDGGLDFAGFKATGEGLGTMLAYHLGYIDDNEKAKIELLGDLKLVALELNPIRKYKKLKKIGEKFVILQKGFKISADLSKRVGKLGSKFSYKLVTLSYKLVLKFDKEKRSFIMKRLELMDDEILEKSLKNPDNFIKNFEDGKYPMLISESSIGKKYRIKIDDEGKIKKVGTDGNFYKPDRKAGSIDFVIIDNKVIFGVEHSYMSNGKNVQYAGGIKTTKKGNIEGIHNSSGHYMPSKDDVEGYELMKRLLKNDHGIDIDKIGFTYN